MNFCLSDLVPPLRWSDAARIRGLREPMERVGLPDAWWRTLPMSRVLTIMDAEHLAGLLAELALEHWPAAAIGDILPALHVIDPDDADDPHVAIALDRVGSWAGLLALSGRELRDQPFIQAGPVLTTLFATVFTRLAAARAVPWDRSKGAGGPGAHAPHEVPAAVPGPFGPAGPFGSAGPFAPPGPPPGPPPVPQPGPQPQPAPPPSLFWPPAPAFPVPEQPVPQPAASDDAAPAPRPPGQEAPTPTPATGPHAGRGRVPADLPTLIDAAFADLDDQAWAVAQNRVFTDSPSDVEQLAKLFAVPPERIHALEGRLRERLAAWLAGPEAVPYTRHVEGLAKLLGVAAPKSRLIAAADWHVRELRSLDIPAWQFVLATLPGYHVAGNWLVVGDLAELHEKTRGLIVNSDRPPTVSHALELVSSLGIHPDVAKEWLENVPQLRIRSGGGSNNGTAAPRSALPATEAPTRRQEPRKSDPPGDDPGGERPREDETYGDETYGDETREEETHGDESTREPVGGAESTHPAEPASPPRGGEPPRPQQDSRSPQDPLASEDPLAPQDPQDRQDPQDPQDRQASRRSPGSQSPRSPQSPDGPHGLQGSQPPYGPRYSRGSQPSHGPQRLQGPRSPQSPPSPDASQFSEGSEGSEGSQPPKPLRPPYGASPVQEERRPRVEEPGRAEPAAGVDSEDVDSEDVDAEDTDESARAGAASHVEGSRALSESPHPPTPADTDAPGDAPATADAEGVAEGRQHGVAPSGGTAMTKEPPAKEDMDGGEERPHQDEAHAQDGEGAEGAPQGGAVSATPGSESGEAGPDTPATSGAIPGTASGAIPGTTSGTTPDAASGATPDAASGAISAADATGRRGDTPLAVPPDGGTAPAGERSASSPAGAPSEGEADVDAGAAGGDPAYKAAGQLKDVALTRRCFRQPDGRWWLRIDVTEEHLTGGPCSMPSGFAAYLGLTPGENRTVRSATGEMVLSWQPRPALDSVRRLLLEAGARPGGHLFVTLSDEGTLRARHLPGVSGTDRTSQALRLVGYTAPGGTMDQALRVIATRIGMTGPVTRGELMNRLRERGDRDLLSLLATPVAH